MKNKAIQSAVVTIHYTGPFTGARGTNITKFEFLMDGWGVGPQEGSEAKLAYEVRPHTCAKLEESGYYFQWNDVYGTQELVVSYTTANGFLYCPYCQEILRRLTGEFAIVEIKDEH